MKTITLLALAALLATACGSSTTNTSEASADPTQPASGDFCADVLGTGRTIIDHCCASDRDKEPVTEASGILTLVTSACDATYGASTRKGRLVAGPNHVACLEAAAALGTSSCAEFSQDIEMLFFPNSPLYTACRGAWEGTQDNGAPCLYPEECKPGLACTGYVAPSDGDAGKEGTCGAPPALGKPCGPTEVDHVSFSVTPIFADHPECASGAHCDFGTCTAGDPPVYGGGKEGSACNEERDCSFPLECVQNACTAPHAAGAPCDGNKECNGWCNAGKCESVCGSN